MKRVEKVEGSAFTRRRSVSHQTERPDELLEGLRELTSWSRNPWEGQREVIEWVERALEIELTGKSPEEVRNFKPREDVGWYLRQLKMFADMADRHVRDGNASWAAHAAVHFGGLYSELQLKLAREELFLIGKRQKEHSEEGIAAWRKGSQEDRVREVDERPIGVPKAQVFRRIAKREGVTPGAVETDYYKAKKNQPTPRD